MPAYVVVDLEIADADAMAAYRPLAKASVEQHGGRYLARGGATDVLEGDWDPERLVVLEFPDVAAARAWYDSADYVEARRLREGAGRCRMVAVAGV